MSLANEELNDRFLRQYHPEILVARADPHPFVPFPAASFPDHVCTARCVCHACWEPKGNRKAHPKALR